MTEDVTDDGSQVYADACSRTGLYEAPKPRSLSAPNPLSFAGGFSGDAGAAGALQTPEGGEATRLCSAPETAVPPSSARVLSLASLIPLSLHSPLYLGVIFAPQLGHLFLKAR
jgi:hypothetical protein